MEVASETILSGKAKVMVAGGFDDLWEEGSYEFGNMKATSNSEPGTELAMGREPTEMSWPTTTTRAGSWSPKASAYTFLCQPRLSLPNSWHSPFHVNVSCACGTQSGRLSRLCSWTTIRSRSQSYVKFDLKAARRQLQLAEHVIRIR
ncbi:hypothetical protein BGY98DRAFT_968840 [Russula aff. rugulosa BPL654]|nr:hypothetical protein BGY98DRAFT_974897 [Russula aff. rugulosa BPL654]KAI0279420.1 hypothetical protein BGY98DRAFT_968840 [Russula aff. rugulosa BPL654]